MVYKNLVNGQAQIGDLVVGVGTNILMDPPNFNADDVQNQDFQTARSDNISFGHDQFKPTTIEFKFTVLDNYLLAGWEDTIPNFWHSMPTIADLVFEWRNDVGRKTWGSMKEIFICNGNGEGRAIYGRPGTGKVTKPSSDSLETFFEGEFRKADTLFYSPEEYVTELEIGEAPNYIYRDRGDADSWMRIWLQGPMVNPRLTIGECDISLNKTIEEGELVEISSYPWNRRIVNNEREFLASNFNGQTPLDRLIIPAGVEVPVRWTSDDYNTFVPDLGNESWAEDIQRTDMWGLFEWKLPSNFTQIAGRTVVRADIFNPKGVTKYISSRQFGTVSSVIYNKTKYNSAAQYSEATIVEPFSGRSAMAIMCNETLTDGIALEVSSGANNRLRIKRVTSPTTLGPTLASWDNPAAFGWKETDKVAIRYNPDTQRYIGYLNGEEKLSWYDPTVTKPIGPLFRYQGFLFDLDDSLWTQGMGFRRIIGYDEATVPVSQGRVLLFWRDAWVSLDGAA